MQSAYVDLLIISMSQGIAIGSSLIVSIIIVYVVVVVELHGEVGVAPILSNLQITLSKDV